MKMVEASLVFQIKYSGNRKQREVAGGMYWQMNVDLYFFNMYII